MIARVVRTRLLTSTAVEEGCASCNHTLLIPDVMS